MRHIKALWLDDMTISVSHKGPLVGWSVNNIDVLITKELGGQLMWRVCRAVWDEVRTPEVWRRVFHFGTKEEVVNVLKNNRGIACVPHSSEVYATVLERRIR